MLLAVVAFICGLPLVSSSRPCAETPRLSSAVWPACPEAPTRDLPTSPLACRYGPARNRAATSEARAAPRRVAQLPPTTSTTRATWEPRYQADKASQRGKRYEIVTFVRTAGCLVAPSAARPSHSSTEERTRESCLAVTSSRRPCLDDPARWPRRRRKVCRARCATSCSRSSPPSCGHPSSSPSPRWARASWRGEGCSALHRRRSRPVQRRLRGITLGRFESALGPRRRLRGPPGCYRRVIGDTASVYAVLGRRLTPGA